MRSSEFVDELAAALSKAQAEYPIVPKSKEAIVPTKTGGEYRYNYADLADAVEATRPVNAANGLSVVQMPGWEDGAHVLTTRVMHQSGQWLEDTMKLILPQETPQVHGSALTYARRYAYCAALGIVTETDDDGALAEIAYGANASRKMKAPKSSTPIGARPPRARTVRADDDGQLGMSPKDRNRLITYFAREHPKKLTDPRDVLLEVNKLLEAPVEAVVKLSAAQGADLFAKLGIGGSPPVAPGAGGDPKLAPLSPEELKAKGDRERAIIDSQDDRPF